jgi:hypothetical protein
MKELGQVGAGIWTKSDVDHDRIDVFADLSVIGCMVQGLNIERDTNFRQLALDRLVYRPVGVCSDVTTSE